MAAGSMANVDGDQNYVRIQVLTNAGALDREKQIALVSQLTDLVAAAAKDPTLRQRYTCAKPPCSSCRFLRRAAPSADGMSWSL
jgi:hypothetical protein